MGYFVHILWPKLLRSCREVVEKLLRSWRGRERGQNRILFHFETYSDQIWHWTRRFLHIRKILLQVLEKLETSWRGRERGQNRKILKASTSNKNFALNTESGIAEIIHQIYPELPVCFECGILNCPNHTPNLSGIAGMRRRKQNLQSRKNFVTSTVKKFSIKPSPLSVKFLNSRYFQLI